MKFNFSNIRLQLVGKLAVLFQKVTLLVEKIVLVYCAVISIFFVLFQLGNVYALYNVYALTRHLNNQLSSNYRCLRHASVAHGT